MKRLAATLILISTASISYASSGDTVIGSKQMIERASKELLDERNEQSDVRRALYLEVNRLDDKVTALLSELRKLEKDEEMRTLKSKTLEKEIERRKNHFVHTSGLLNQYSKAFVSRIHPAEYQLHKQTVAEIDQSALDAVNEPVREIEQRLKVLSIGIGRLESVVGGKTFPGKAFGFAGRSIDGTFLLLGPSVFFAAMEGLHEGICPASDTGTNLPAVVSINNSNGMIAKALSAGQGLLPLDGTSGKAILAEIKHPGGQNKALEHIMLFKDIAQNMMFDGWIAIAICILMIGVGWTVAFRKILYLNSIEKGNREFLEEWGKVSNDLTTLERNCESSSAKLNETPNIKRSPFYEIYHIGSEEITNRVAAARPGHKGLSGRSIQAVRAALDAGLVRLHHKLTGGLVYLTISIAGGPYVGLLGTVVGVMITFAIISKEGEVNVNAIAPGIASALLATVAGLIVAIPALFVYSYLNNRIKNIISELKVFIDEFVSKMAEFHPQVNHATPAKFGDASEDSL